MPPCHTPHMTANGTPNIDFQATEQCILLSHVYKICIRGIGIFLLINFVIRLTKRMVSQAKIPQAGVFLKTI